LELVRIGPGHSGSATMTHMRRISQRELRNDISAVLRRVMAGERLRVTVAGRDAADLVPIDEAPAWTSGRRAHELITPAQADMGLSSELGQAFPGTTDEL
jgi:prevent-host-death family protein